MKKLFVTGTDTEVGKTVVTRAIVRRLVDAGVKVAALKPVESGAPERDGELHPHDVEALLGAARSHKRPADVCAYMFREPVSPHLAAAMEGRAIERGPILDLLSRASEGNDVVIAEGAGGLMVPLSFELVYADLIADSGFDLLIVAPNVLGTINATLLTIEAARRRGITVAGVVLNRTPTAEWGNAEAIRRHGRVEILGELPDTESDDDVLLGKMAAAHMNLCGLAEGL